MSFMSLRGLNHTICWPGNMTLDITGVNGAVDRTRQEYREDDSATLVWLMQQEDKGIMLFLWVENREAAHHREWIFWEVRNWHFQFSFMGATGSEEWWVIRVHRCGESGSVQHENLSSKAFAMHFHEVLLALVTVTCHQTATSEIIVLSKVSRYYNITC